MKNIKTQDIFLLASLCILLFLGSAATVFFPAPQFSPRENRYLSNMPSLTKNTLFTGDYTKGIDLYLAEHIPTRELMREVRAATELSLGKCAVNGVLVCPDGRLIQLPTANERIRQQNLRQLSALQSRAEALQTPCTVAVLPEQASLTELLPMGYPVTPGGSDKALCSLLNNPDYWYRTDHHMTTDGAFALYTHLGKKLDYTPYGIDKFTRVAVGGRFLGTSDAKAGIPFTKPDVITLYRYEDDRNYTISKDGKLFPLTGLYDMEKLSTRDGYGVFLGGNHALLEITRGVDDTRPVLLVIKDSYANTLLPFLAMHYRLLVVDPRYGSPDITTLLTRADRMLVLCGEGTLSVNFLSGIRL